jgi:hypothetical protein
MSFTDREHVLLNSLKENPVGYPFSLDDKELEDVVRAIKRERGNEETKARRAIRVYVASKFGWNFAMDGGFMVKTGDKIWQDSAWPNSQIYQLFENLVLYLLNDNWTMDAIDAAIMEIWNSSSCLQFKYKQPANQEKPKTFGGYES